MKKILGVFGIAAIIFIFSGCERRSDLENTSNENEQEISVNNIQNIEIAYPESVVNQRVELSTGLVYVDKILGTGITPQVGNKVSVHYIGKLKDGKTFDSSYSRNEPFIFTYGVDRVIEGWFQGLGNMKVGGTRQLIVPPELGYGEFGFGAGLIPGNATLYFEVKLLDIIEE